MKTILTGLWLALAASATTIEFTTYDVPGADQTLLVDVNNSNAMLGVTVQNDANPFGGPLVRLFLARPNQPLVYLEPPGSTFVYDQVGMSNPGSVFQVAGSFVGSDNRTHGWIYHVRSGEYTQFDVPGARETHLTDVNAFGTVIGTYVDQNGMDHGFVAHNGRIREIAPGGIGINENIRQHHEFTLYPNGLRRPDGTFSQISIEDPTDPTRQVSNISANGFNNSLFIVGTYSGEAGDVHGFVSFRELRLSLGRDAQDRPITAASIPTGINDFGRIVGGYVDPRDGRAHGFIGAYQNDAPEPAAAGLGLLGLGTLWFLRRRLRQKSS